MAGELAGVLDVFDGVGVGEDSGFEGVLGGARFAFLRARAGGLLCVSAVGGEFGR